ncbi:hypothetical protein MPSEU_001071300 [Mayamaea pseudoterrestris]|nr:hypothetical protein MPSEU_001071300 [Mayamaea pseudoterrestris]
MVKSAAFYAVAAGRNVGVYRTWNDCQAQTKGFSKARFKKFNTLKDAQDFVAADGNAAAGMYTTPSSASTHGQAHSQKRTLSSNRDSEVTPSSTAYSSSDRYHKECLDVTIHFDGGSRGNPGVAGSGAVVTIREFSPFVTHSSQGSKRHKITSHRQNKEIHICRSVGTKHTNNQAEYQGVIDGLQIAKQEIAKYVDGTNKTEPSSKNLVNINVSVLGDSNLVIEQLKGNWQCRNGGLVPLCQEAKRLLHDLRAGNGARVALTHVYRHLNGEADRLANLAMDTKETFVTTSDDNHEQRIPF